MNLYKYALSFILNKIIQNLMCYFWQSRMCLSAGMFIAEFYGF